MPPPIPQKTKAISSAAGSASSSAISSAAGSASSPAISSAAGSASSSQGTRNSGAASSAFLHEAPVTPQLIQGSPLSQPLSPLPGTRAPVTPKDFEGVGAPLIRVTGAEANPRPVVIRRGTRATASRAESAALARSGLPRTPPALPQGLTSVEAFTGGFAVTPTPRNRTAEQTILWLDYPFCLDCGVPQGGTPSPTALALVESVFKNEWTIPVVLSVHTNRVGILHKYTEAAVQNIANQLLQLGVIGTSELGRFPSNDHLAFFTTSPERRPSQLIREFRGLGNHVFISASYENVVDCLDQGIAAIQVHNSRQGGPQQELWIKAGFNAQPYEPFAWTPKNTVSDAVDILFSYLLPNAGVTGQGGVKVVVRHIVRQAWLETNVWPHNHTHLSQLCQWLRIIIRDYYPNGVGPTSTDTHVCRAS